MATHRESADKILGYTGKLARGLWWILQIDRMDRRFRAKRPILRTAAELYVRMSAGVSIIKYRFRCNGSGDMFILFSENVNKMNTLTTFYIVYLLFSEYREKRRVRFETSSRQSDFIYFYGR